MSELYYRDKTSRGEIDTSTPSIDTLTDLHDFLQNEKLRADILRGNVTLAMIRPSLEVATNLEGEDVAIAETIEEDIYYLGIKAKFAIRFNPTTVSEFYADAKQRMITKPPETSANFPNRWTEFESLMLAGPTTVLLLESPNGDAIDLWRQQVGHWDITNQRDPMTLRGKFGLDSHNNLVHGSDTPEAVLRELAIISQCLDTETANDENDPRT